MWSFDPCYERFISDKDFKGQPFQKVTAKYGSDPVHWVFQEASRVVHVQHPPAQRAHIFKGGVFPLSVLLQKNHDLAPQAKSILAHALFDTFDAAKRREALQALSSGCVYYENQVQEEFDQNTVWRIDPTQWNWTFDNTKDSLEKIVQPKTAFKRFENAFVKKTSEKDKDLFTQEDARQFGELIKTVYRGMPHDLFQNFITKSHLAVVWLNTIDTQNQGEICFWDITKTPALVEEIYYPDPDQKFTIPEMTYNAADKKPYQPTSGPERSVRFPSTDSEDEAPHQGAHTDQAEDTVDIGRIAIDPGWKAFEERMRKLVPEFSLS